MKLRLILGIGLAGLLAHCAEGNGTPETEGKEVKSAQAIYTRQCAICHGDDGRKGLAGAKMIPDSELSMEERIALITNGKGNMMPYRDILTKEEIRKVAAYTLTLK